VLRVSGGGVMKQATGVAGGWHVETALVHAGTMRSSFNETSEALFLTQGHVYDSAEQCAARFTGDDPGFIYARFSNPTVSMFEQRMAALEGAEAARATATGMAAVTAALMGLVKAGDHVVAARAAMSWRSSCHASASRRR
jgi:O-succinylhomoserine sulfhydrylase